MSIFHYCPQKPIQESFDLAPVPATVARIVLTPIAMSELLIPEPFFTHTIALRWRDMDSYQHVNNSEYLTLCEEARIAWFRSLQGPWRSETAEPVIARIELDYKKPLVHPANVVVRLSLERLGNSSLSLHHTLATDADATIYAVGKCVLVWTNPQTGRATPVPEFVRHSVQPNLFDPNIAASNLPE